MQDTSQFQFELIQSLFDKTSVIIQKFGDPYQAIYNIWGGDTELAWEIDDSMEKRISKNIAIRRVYCKYSEKCLCEEV